MKWDNSQLKSLSLTHPLICNTLPLSLLTQEQARTLETREGRDWRRDWRKEGRGRRKELAATHGHPSPLNPLSWWAQDKPPSFLGFFSQRFDPWFLMQDWGFLAGGGSIMCRVSPRVLYLAQSLKHSMDCPLIHLLVYCKRKLMSNPSLGWRS